jgi:pyruvate/2-oxoglutarate dehydrogenase complex dihydrolipoamide acyltransferase (E2) component
LARALARERGVDLAKVLGSGPGGRVERSDVIGYAETVAGRAYVMREKAKIPLTGMRAAIAKRMVAAKATAAHTYLFFEIDITKLLATRKTILGDEEELGTRVSLIAFYTRALALACEEVPVCNSTLANDEITIWDNVNVGIAVALPGRGKYDSGLIVPVVRDVQDRGLLQIARETKELVRKARAGELSPQDTSDGTITLSSTDSFLPGGWMVSAPLLNLPQVVGFQPGTPIEKPVVREGQIAVRTMLPCGLTYDHRAMDGEPIGRFVRRLRDLLTDPELMLL